MTIIKDKEFDDLGNKRFDIEMKLQDGLIKAKDEEIKKYKDSRATVRTQFEQNVDLQKGMQEETDLKQEIEDAHVSLDLLQIQVKELEDATEFLNEKKEEMIEAKKHADVKNEELRKELSAKEEIATKRLQAKLNRDKNVEVKELIA